MCGIVGYIGNRDAYPIIINGLKRLEYRGYDSAGIALLDGKLTVHKKKGKVTDLESHISETNHSGTLGIGHTRWATHGEPSDVNAHPHTSQKGKFTIIHNGIIENYLTLKNNLSCSGYEFKSETDTEVLANLIEYIYLEGNVSAEMAVKHALSKVFGAYGLVILCDDEPDKIIAVRKSSPLVLGIGDNEYFIASDATPIIEHTDMVIYMNNDDIAILTRSELKVENLQDEKLVPRIEKIDLDIHEIEKDGYEHFMLKEIFEQPRSIEATFRGRIASDHCSIHLGGLYNVRAKLITARRIIIVGCGTSWHAALIGEYLLEDIARVQVEVEYASEFRYRNPLISAQDVVIAISQSGETADTLAAVRLAKECGATVLGICNVAGSSISRETDAGVYTHAGPEIGVASTKAFTAQVTVLAMIAFMIGHQRGHIDNEKYHSLISELAAIPAKIEGILRSNDKFREIAIQYAKAANFLYLGRGVSFPVALEGALKLKEISYIHAEGYPAAEMKHGPIALIDHNMPVVVIATQDKSYEKIVSNIQEIKARNGIVIAIVTEGDKIIKSMANHVVEIPVALNEVTALLSVVPLQLIAYHMAVLRGCNVDQPRNLAKSVTVE